MPDNDVETMLAGIDNEAQPSGFAIAPGIVVNNVDLVGEGRVQVRIPSMPGFNVWARLSAIGGAGGRGFLWVPSLNDEVLLAFSKNDERDAYVIGGLWSTLNRPPVPTGVQAVVKRTLKTGQTSAVGHEIEFDDALQSITITSSTQQKIVIDPLKIAMSNTAGTLSITLDNTSQAISIQAAAKLELKAATVSIEGLQIELKGTVVKVQAAGPCTVKGLPVKIN
jgi:uncharacterized protein involved in type VI secretion and phage assembly